MKDNDTRKIESIKNIVHRAFISPMHVVSVEFAGDYLPKGKPARHIDITTRTAVDYDVVEKLCDAFCTKQYAISSTPRQHELCLILFDVTFPWER